MIYRIKRLLGVDRAILFTLVARGWSVVAGLMTIVFVTRFLSQELQGYYYTFNSLIALQVFVELGLNFAIIQFASHEMAKLSWTDDGILVGDAGAKRRLQSLLHFALVWFGAAAVLMIVVLLPVGIYFFLDASKNSPAPSVSMAWSLLVVFSAINLVTTAAVAILEGCGKVAQVAMLRLCQSVFAVVAIWIVLSFGGHLYALAMNSLMTAVVGFVWIWSRYRKFFKDLLRHRTLLQGLDWRNEIWPFQWRIALSWMSGYLMFQLFTPLLFATHGPVVAGQMGMSLQIIGAMNSSAMAWISTKAPTYGKLVATGQSKALDTLFFRGLFQSLIFLSTGVVCVWLIFYYLFVSGAGYGTRVLPPFLFAILGFVAIANHIVSAEAVYLRAHKQEPFMLLSILSGTITAILAWLLVPGYGVSGAVYSYAATALLVTLVGGTFIFIRKRKEWAV
ncbi:putative membrane protein [Collimonas fungivorans]|uniref:Putative membrane protein n=1 Tax=Collimonas fungivorans TaxID=158899 RepID=A0A127P7J7_9BURK|nr:oligosaccharide flippase family protein [Collimonas fungivorans]AMO93789.1 putative membrane protein [Collimonas fungivorans]